MSTKPTRFRKKPVEIEAMQVTTDPTRNLTIQQWGEDSVSDDQVVPVVDRGNSNTMLIHTLEGTMTALPGDWIIRGVQGEFYPCKPDIFEATYELADGGEAA